MLFFNDLSKFNPMGFKFLLVIAQFIWTALD